MDLGSLLVIFSVLILVGIFVSRPFFLSPSEQGASVPVDADLERKRSELMAEYDRTLNALQELDFDQGLGKIPAEEYPIQRAVLVTAAGAALGKLDAIQEEGPSQSIEARLEAAIAARRADTAQARAGKAAAISQGQIALAEDPLEQIVAARRQDRVEKSGGFCPRCGRPVQKSDRFCPRCGGPLVG
jgi:rubrerythrin